MFEILADVATGVATTTATTPSTSVSVPWGDWIVGAINVAQPIVLLALSGVTTYIMSAFVPPWIRAFAGDAAQRRINQVLEKAVLSAIAQTKDVVAGKRTTVPLASEVLARAAQYAVDQAPDLVKHATDGKVDNLLKMLMARMEALEIAPHDFDSSQVKTNFPVDVTKMFGK